MYKLLEVFCHKYCAWIHHEYFIIPNRPLHSRNYIKRCPLGRLGHLPPFTRDESLEKINLGGRTANIRAVWVLRARM